MNKCFICNAPFTLKKTVKARKYYYAVCTNCTGAILQPRIKALKAVKKAYQRQYFDWKVAGGIRTYINKFQLFTSYPEWIFTLTKKKGILLDVGAGIPDFVLKMKNLGWKVKTMEISPEQTKLISQHIGVKNSLNGDFETKKIPTNSFDVLTFWHMLEHMKNPYKAIAKSNQVLKKNGFIFAEFPNFDSFNLKLFGQDYCYFDLPGHLVYYNKRSLIKLFEQNNFKIIEISYPLKLNGSFAYNFSALIYRKTGSEFLKMFFWYSLMPFSLFLAVCFVFTGQTDLMRIVAQKN